MDPFSHCPTKSTELHVKKVTNQIWCLKQWIPLHKFHHQISFMNRIPWLKSNPTFSLPLRGKYMSCHHIIRHFKCGIPPMHKLFLYFLNHILPKASTSLLSNFFIQVQKIKSLEKMVCSTFSWRFLQKRGSLWWFCFYSFIV